MKRLLLFLLVALLALPATCSFAAENQLPQTGQQAPAFMLPSQDKQEISLSSYRGKWVVLYFYPKDQTTGCTLEAHNFQRDLSKYEAAHAVILGVSVDSADSHKSFCTKEGLSFHLLADTEKGVTSKYGSLGGRGMALRNTFLIDPKGQIAKVWTGVDPAQHSEEVLAELKTLQKK